MSHSRNTVNKTLAQILGSFVAEFPMEQLPVLALERAKMSLASTLSSAAMGVRIDSARIIRELELKLAAGGTSSVWFDNGRLPVDRAARVNALASDAAASDDSDMRSIAHIGTIVSTTGVAMAERQSNTGRELLAAMVLGYEIAGRVDEALTPGRMQRGFHGSVSTIFGGAVTAGRLLRLNAEQMAQAIAIAATSAGGMAIAADTSCAREYHAGLAAQLGIQAALAAQARFKAELNVLESPRGFFDAFNAFNDHAVAEVSQGLGQSWDIVTDMAIKLMPGAHPFHAIAEATWTAAIEHDVNPETIRRIVISAPQLKVWAHQAIQPHDLIGAAHSVPYFVASSLVDRRFGWDHFSLEKMRDPRIAAMLTRVCFDPDPQPHPDRFPHRHGGTVTLELMNGQVIRSTCQAPRGSGARGIDWVDVDHKYRQLISVANMSSSSIESSLSLIHQLQDQTSLMPLISFFNPQKQA